VARAAGTPDLARRWLGETDYDIPRFGFVSAAVVTASLVIAVFVVPALTAPLAPSLPLATPVAQGLLVGFSVAVMEFFHENDRGPCPGFWFVAAALSAALAAVFCVLFV